MTPSYLAALIGTVLVLIAIRILVPAVPFLRRARPIRRVDALLVLVGVVGLVIHCGSMFARAFVLGVPGAALLVGPIDELGAVSAMLFALPAVLLLIGMRRQWPPVPVVLLLALVAVGVTMYDGGALRVHLTAIFSSVVVLAVALLFFVSALGRRTPAEVATPEA